MAKKILIVEDEKEIVEFLEIFLKKEGFIVESLYNGKGVFEKIEEFKPNFVILDIVLPYSDGLEILSWIKKNHSQIKVILTTAKEELNDIKRGFSLDADYYLTKPYTKEEVLKAINLLNYFKE